MLSIVLSEAAEEDLAAMTDFIGQRNLIAAARLWSKIHFYATSERIPGYQ